MTGDGALTGTLAAPRADLRAAFARVNAGPLHLTDANLTLSFRKGADASDGSIAVTAGSNYGPARAAGNFYLGGPRIRLTEVDLDAGGITARGDIALSNSIPSSADLTFTARPGAFLASGEANGRVRLTEGGGAETAILDVSGRNVRFAGSPYVVRTLDLDGRGTLERLPFTLKATSAAPRPCRSTAPASTPARASPSRSPCKAAARCARSTSPPAAPPWSPCPATARWCAWTCRSAAAS